MKNAWKSPGARVVLIVVLTVLAYIPVLRGGFLWDDNVYVVRNQALRTFDGLRSIWTVQATVQRYYPLVSTSFWFQYHLWKVQPLGYHLVNILLHAVNAVLVWVILQRLKIPGAWLAALVFAVHPVNVATVAWVSEQKNTLSMLFYATAILLYLRFDKEGRWRCYGFSVLAFILALLSKTAVVMLPVVLLLCMWWQHGRVRRKDLLRSVPFFVLSLASGLLTIQVENSANGELVVRSAGFLSRLAGAGWAPWFYLSKALLPVNLTVVYPKWEPDASRWISYVPGVALIGCFACFWWKRQTWGRPLLFGLGYFVVTLFPVLGFFDQSFYAYSLVADHWQYFSIIGVIALVVAAGERMCQRMDGRPRFTDSVAGVAVLLMLGVGTWGRGCLYANAETLWRDNMARNPNSAVVRNNLGGALAQAGRASEAIGYYEQALRLKPDFPKAHNNLGIALAQVGRMPEAIAQHEQALRTEPDYAEARYNLAVTLARVGRVPEAMDQWNKVLQINPEFAEAHYNLGVAFEKGGQLTDAIQHYQQAVRINPDYSQARNALARLLAGQ